MSTPDGPAEGEERTGTGTPSAKDGIVPRPFEAPNPTTYTTKKGLRMPLDAADEEPNPEG